MVLFCDRREYRYDERAQLARRGRRCRDAVASLASERVEEAGLRSPRITTEAARASSRSSPRARRASRRGGCVAALANTAEPAGPTTCFVRAEGGRSNCEGVLSRGDEKKGLSGRETLSGKWGKEGLVPVSVSPFGVWLAEQVGRDGQSRCYSSNCSPFLPHVTERVVLR